MASQASGIEPAINPDVAQDVAQEDSARKPKSEVVDPMIPHSRRDQVSVGSRAPKGNDESGVIDPMIPHNSRRDME